MSMASFFEVVFPPIVCEWKLLKTVAETPGTFACSRGDTMQCFNGDTRAKTGTFPVLSK